MKIPSLIKITKHKRFHFEPRYYDPIKEEIKERTARIKKEIDSSSDTNYHSNISNAFSRRSTRQKQSNALQFSFIVLFFAAIFGYIYYGNAALYALMIIIPVYILFKIKKNL